MSLAASIVLVAVALVARWEPLTGRDLYNDEALMATITRGFLEDGALNNFRYSRFTPDSMFVRGTWTYYPPGFNLVQAPFLLNDPASSVAARLPTLILNMVALVFLPILSKAVWHTAAPGLVAAAFSALSPFPVNMSVTALPYTLMSPVMLLAVAALVRAFRRGGTPHWIAVGVLIALAYYIQPTGLFLGAFLMIVVAAALRRTRVDRVRGALTAGALSIALCVPWLLFSWGSITPLHALVTRHQDYSLAGQAILVFEQYDLMLPLLLWKAAFLVGLVSLVRRTNTEEGLPGLLLACWAVAPLLYLLSKTMWVTPRHVFPATAAVILVTAYGFVVASRRLAAVSGIAPLRREKLVDVTALVLTLLVAGGHFIWVRSGADGAGPYRPIDHLLRGDAAMEFGAKTMVSTASAYIGEHGQGEPVIATIGHSEAFYLERFVQDTRSPEATARAWTLARSGPAWVFVGDNFDGRGALDDFERVVQQHGRLIMRSPPVAGFTTPDNTVGYALYYLDRPLPPAPDQ